MNNIFSKKGKNMSNLIKIYLLSIIPVIIYGLYKNSYLLISNNLINNIELFKPLYYIAIPFIIILLINFIRYKKIMISYQNLPYIFISLFISYNTNILVYTFLLLIFIVLDYIFKHRYNFSILFFILLSVINTLINNYSYLNPMEANLLFDYTLFDLLLGREVGGVFSSSLIFSMITFFVLHINIYYKKIIPFISISIYVLLILIFSFFTNITFINIGGIFLAITLLGTYSYHTPLTKRGQIIYATILGIIILPLSLLTNYYEGIFISILIMQILVLYTEKLLQKK